MRRMGVTSLVRGLIVSLTVALGCFTAWLVWVSLDWPIVVDGGFFHFIGAQMLLGEVLVQPGMDESHMALVGYSCMRLQPVSSGLRRIVSGRIQWAWPS